MEYAKIGVIRKIGIHDRQAHGGMFMVELEGQGSEEDLQSWIDRGFAYAQSLPPK